MNLISISVLIRLLSTKRIVKYIHLFMILMYDHGTRAWRSLKKHSLLLCYDAHVNLCLLPYVNHTWSFTEGDTLHLTTYVWHHNDYLRISVHVQIKISITRFSLKTHTNVLFWNSGFISCDSMIRFYDRIIKLASGFAKSNLCVTIQSPARAW